MLKQPSIMERVREHLEEAHEHFEDNYIVGIFLQGSQNYGLELPGSDVDTKLIVCPTFKEIAMNEKPVSTTHIRANEEHIDFKDIRLYMQTFRKQNLNFLEILFTDFKIINPLFAAEWQKLVDARELIASMNPYRAVKSMKGIAMEKYHALKHPYPSKIPILEKHGYDPKQLHHLLRVQDYLDRYIKGESYEECLHPSESMRKFLLSVKLGNYSLDFAERVGAESIKLIEEMTNEFFEMHEDKENPEAVALLNEVQLNIMRLAMGQEFKR